MTLTMHMASVTFSRRSRLATALLFAGMLLSCPLLCVAQETPNNKNSPATSGTADQAGAQVATSPKRMIAPAGVSLQSTEASELGTTNILAPTPSVVLTGNQVVIASQDATETLAVQSGAELLKALGLVAPPVAKAGMVREKDIPQATDTLFNEEEVKKLLGEQPTVVYRVVVNGTPIPDPMIVPWVRETVVVKERFDEAVELLAQKKIDQGKQALLSIVTEYPGTEYATQSGEILKKLRDLEGEPKGPAAVTPRVTQTPTPTPVVIVVDSNVRVGTVMVDPNRPEDNRVAINGAFYRPGDTVRNFANHKIISISDDTVVIEVEQFGQKKQIPVPVRKPGLNRR